MTKISRYAIDDKVTGSDKWIGSDAQTQYTTKNFTPTKLAVYFNENQIIDIGTPIRYKYDILEVGDVRLPGTITFDPQVGTPYSLSNISSFILSKHTLKGNDVTQYLNFLIGSKVLIYKADDINIFGLYNVVSLIENITEPAFFDVVVSYITGNGSIVEDKDYLISLIDITSGNIPTKTSDLINDGEDGINPFITLQDIPPSTTPNLNSVLLEGNTSLLDAKIGELYLYDTTITNYGKIQLNNNVFTVTNSLNNNIISSEVGTLRVWNTLGVEGIFNYTSLTGGRIYNLPDNSGTIALTSDLASYVPYTGATGDINIGNNSIYTDGGAKLWNNGIVEGTSFQFAGYVGSLQSIASTNKSWLLPDVSGTIALTSDIPTKTSDLINDGENGINPFITLNDIPTVTGFVPYTGATQDVDLGVYDITAAHLIKDGGQSIQFLKADGSVDNNVYLTSADLPSTLDLYATTTASDVSGYTVLVRNISDSRFNTTAVDVSTGVITTTAQLVGSLVSDANIISGNPGIFNITTIGNISRTSGTGQAEFFFRVYKRDNLGVETFITESSKTLPVTNGGYVEFSAVALWNDGIFTDTDRVVLKYYADRLTSPVGSNPVYKFQFGGISPVRSTAAIPVAVLPNIYLRDLADVENVDALNNEVLYWNDTASLWEHSLVTDLPNVGTVKSIAALTLGTTGTDLSSTVANGTTTPVITLNVPTASATNRGALSTTDWTTFNGKFTLPSLTNGSVLFSNGTTIAQDNSNFFWDYTNNRLGIGTNVPTARVHIKAPGALSTDIALRVRNSADTFDIIRANGAGDVFIGLGAGNVTTGISNTFIGIQAGLVNSTAAYNTGIGARALANTTTGGYNTAIGRESMSANTIGVLNTSVGVNSLSANIGGNNNVALGAASMQNNTSGSNNVSIGTQTPVPTEQNTTGSNNIFLGFNAVGVSKTESNRTWIGNSSTTSTWLGGNLLLGTTTDQGGKLQVKAPGALSTDIALRVRNSADTFDLLRVNGVGGLNVTGTAVGTDTLFKLTNNGSTSFVGAFDVLSPSASNGSTFYYRFGKATTTNNTSSAEYFHTSDGSSSNRLSFNIGTSNISLLAGGNVGVGTTAPVASAKVQIDSTTQGFLPPRMTNAQRIAIATPAVGLCVYCTDVVEGLYINKSTGWTYIG